MSTWPNMPVGMSAVTDYDCTRSTMGAAGIFDAYNSSFSGSDGTAPVSPSSTIFSRINAGNTSGGMQLEKIISGLPREMFVGIMWRTNAGFAGRQVGNKLYFHGGPPGIGSGLFLFGAGGSQGAAQKAIVWSFNSGKWDNSHISSDLGLYPNAGSGLATTGQWTRLESYVKSSTTLTSRDGVIRWWVNGTLAGNYTNVNYCPEGLGFWTWTETWDGTVNPAPSVDWEHHLDHIFMATRTGGPSGGGGGGGTPTLTSLTPAVATLAPGNSQVLTVGMSAVVTSSTTVSFTSSAPTVVSVGATAVISPGNASANFLITAVGAGTAIITATVGSTSQTSTITVTSGGGTSTPVTYTYASQFSSTQGQNQWSYRDTGGNLLTYNAGGLKWEGDELYLAIWSTGFVHGYNGSLKGAVLRWTAPASGSVSITGTAALYDNPATGIFTVQCNAASIFGPQTMSVATSYPYALNQAVSAGDTIDFILSPVAGGTNNNSRLDPVIVFTPTSTGGGGVTVSSMSPAHGNIGSSVTIVGTGFSGTAINNTITVNGVPATITSASTTQLIFTVPSGATTGLVNVSTSAGSASAGTYTVDDPVTPDTPPASNFGGSAMLLLVLP